MKAEINKHGCLVLTTTTVLEGKQLADWLKNNSGVVMNYAFDVNSEVNGIETRKDKCTLHGVICRVFGHKYEVTRTITPRIRELRCKRCGKRFGMNDDMQILLPLDKELIDAHNVLLHGI